MKVAGFLLHRLLPPQLAPVECAALKPARHQGPGPRFRVRAADPAAVPSICGGRATRVDQVFWLM
jgi:hypothetical protein